MTSTTQGPTLTREEQLALRAAAQLECARRWTTDAVRWRNQQESPEQPIRLIPWQRELGVVCDRLVDSALAGTGLRATVGAPAGHGKTELVGRGVPIRAFLEFGHRKEEGGILYITSTGPRAEKVSHQVRTAIERIHAQTGDDRYAPGRKWGTLEWETKGHLEWVATGWESATGGLRGRIVIMDDMIGSSETYRSPSKRERIRRVVQEDALSRLHKGGAALHMETRRGTDDTTAWLHREYPGVWEPHVWKCWDPARGDGDKAYLWPAQYGVDWRATMPHLTDSSPVWRSLYQQEPIPEGGTIIQPEWLMATYPEPPEVARIRAEFVVIGCDLTNTKKKTSDPAAFTVLGRRGAYRDILHVVERRCGYVEQRQILRDLVATWTPDAVIVERAAGGDQMVDELQGEIAGIDGRAPVGDKVTRLTPFLGRYAAGQIRTPVDGERWVGPWREEHAAFTGLDGELDNQVDATTWALVGAEIVTEGQSAFAVMGAGVFG